MDRFIGEIGEQLFSADTSTRITLVRAPAMVRGMEPARRAGLMENPPPGMAQRAASVRASLIPGIDELHKEKRYARPSQRT